MSVFNMLAAVSAALLMTGAASAKEKPDRPKPRKICRTEQMPGRITPQRICRPAPRPDEAGEKSQREGAGTREAGSGRN